MQMTSDTGSNTLPEEVLRSISLAGAAIVVTVAGHNTQQDIEARHREFSLAGFKSWANERGAYCEFYTNRDELPGGCFEPCPEETDCDSGIYRVLRHHHCSFLVVADRTRASTYPFVEEFEPGADWDAIITLGSGSTLVMAYPIIEELYKKADMSTRVVDDTA